MNALPRADENRFARTYPGLHRVLMLSRNKGTNITLMGALFCRDEVCQITVSGRRACYEDGNVRAARQGIGGRSRRRSIRRISITVRGRVAGQAARVPDMGGCLAGTITSLSCAEPDDMSDSNEGNRMRS